MADFRGEPTMEEILASIRRIIAEDPAPSARASGSRKGGGKQRALPADPVDTPPAEHPAGSFEAHLEAAREDLEIPPAPDTGAANPAPEGAEAMEEDEVLELTQIANAAPPTDDSGILSATAALAAAERFQKLTETIAPGAGAMTLENLVRDMLRPMLKQWLDANLPDIVDQVVSREIARLTGKER